MKVLLLADAQAKRLDHILIELLVDSIDENNSNVEFLFVNKTIITAFCYQNGELIMRAACFQNSRFNACLATRMVSQ